MFSIIEAKLILHSVHATIRLQPQVINIFGEMINGMEREIPLKTKTQ